MNKPSKLCWYDKLSCTDMRKWEDTLIKWAETNNLEASMIFDPELLRIVGEKFKKTSLLDDIGKEGRVSYTENLMEISTERLVVQYYIMTDHRAVLSEISINTHSRFNREVIYKAPNEWGNSIWYAF